MAFKNQLELHHNFVKLAEESGFSFNAHKSRHHVDWNKIRLVDVDNLMRDRKFVLIEQHVNDILDCALESEFDVRILDEGVVKMFRLAQLTIEYQQFCRHYLDRSVYVLRDELTSVMQQLEAARKDLREKDEEVKKHKRKSKHNFRPTLMYGNDNIASLILKTLSNNGEMLPTTSLLDLSHQYNKCNYCDKVFLNQLYLKSHITRRHAHVTEIPQKDSPQKDLEDNAQKDKDKLNDEINELKSKLIKVETSITNMNTLKAITVDTGIQSNITETENNIVPQTRAAESSTTIQNNLLEHKLEAWKKEEHDKYTKEIDALRSQLMDTINSLKEAPNTNQNESILIQQLQQTIKEQGQQIIVLTREITENNAKAEKEKAEKNKDIEAQLRQWMQKVDFQTQQQEQLVLRLNDVAKEAQESRAAVEAERHRAARLENLLQQREKTPSSPEQIRDPDKRARDYKQQSIRCGQPINNLQAGASLPTIPSNASDVAKTNCKSKLTPHRKTLDELHQKAQELLNMKSSSSSEESSSEHLNYFPREPVQNTRNELNGVKTFRKNKNVEDDVNRRGNNKEKKVKVKRETSKNRVNENPKQISIEKVHQVNGPVILRSPVKVVRAKLSEEVNNRLVTAGVDPLKSGLHQTDYNKQRMQLQQEQRLKAKKNPDFDKVRNSIIAYLDSKAGGDTSHPIESSSETITPTRMTKAFSLTSVISNVKNKALSFVKHNEVNKRARTALTGDVAKRAMALLKTPPGSAHSSPIKTRRSYDNELHTAHNRESNVSTRKRVDSSSARNKDNKKKVRKPPVATQESNEDLSDSSASDHKYYDSTSLTKSAKSIENLIKSPVRRPSTANGDYSKDTKEVTEGTGLNSKSYSVSNVHEAAEKKITIHNEIHSSSNEEVANKADLIDKKNMVNVNAHTSPKQAKGVLKNAPSTNSLNKKKVIFDLDAIQMKSVSASPSQSTEKSDTNEKYELGLVNLDDDEWDISSIDNEPLKSSDREIKLSQPHRTSPKIAELKQTIESQLANRKTTQSLAPVGGIDVLKGPVTKVASIGGSNTTLGSSVFDDDPVPTPTFIKPKLKRAEKDDSELDLSDFSIDGMTGGKRDSF